VPVEEVGPGPQPVRPPVKLQAPRTREGLKLAVQLYAGLRDEDLTGQAVLNAADVFDQRLAQCPPVLPDIGEQVLKSLEHVLSNQEAIMTALTDLQAADASLQAEVAAFLADIATALQAEDPDIEQVVTDINTEVAALQAADPANAVPPVVAPPAAGGTSN
jgi:hypothetical protein